MTTNDLIYELENISEDKKSLPIVIIAPNGIECRPNIKMMFENDIIATKDAKVEKMVITWRD